MTHMRGIEFRRKTCQKVFPHLTDVVFKLNALWSDYDSVFSFSRLRPACPLHTYCIVYVVQVTMVCLTKQIEDRKTIHLSNQTVFSPNLHLSEVSCRISLSQTHSSDAHIFSAIQFYALILCYLETMHYKSSVCSVPVSLSVFPVQQSSNFFF